MEEMQETQVRRMGSERSLQSRKWQPAPVLLTGKYHGQRSLMGYSPLGWKERDTIKHTHTIPYR